MKNTAAVLLLMAVVLLLSGSRAIAQHSQHQQPAQAVSKTDTKAKPMATEDMMSHHREMVELVDQLRKSLDTLESEKEPSAMKQKLAEHRALLDQLQTKMKHGSEMMQQMNEHMKTCPMMGSGHKHE